MPMSLCLKAQNNPRQTRRKKERNISREEWWKYRTIRTCKERLLHETNLKKTIRRRRKNKQSKRTME